MQNRELNTNIESHHSIEEIPANYPPTLFFNIDHMWLSVEPDFNAKTISCEQQLKITSLQDLDKIELDCSYNDKHKIKIDSIYYSDLLTGANNKNLLFQQYNDKLLIEIGSKLPEGSKFYIIINYSAKNGQNHQMVLFL